MTSNTIDNVQSFNLQTCHGEVESQQTSVPPNAFRFFLTAGIGVVIELRAQVNRWLVRKRISFQKRRHRWFILQQTPDETPKPWQAPGVVERREPHLPVQARLMRDVPGRASRNLSRLVSEFVFAPFDAVVRTLNDDFVALRGH